MTTESEYPFNMNACHGHENGHGHARISAISDIVAMGYNPRSDGIKIVNPAATMSYFAIEFRFDLSKNELCNF